MSVKENFATRLKKLREIAELSQVELAEKLSVSRGSISYYENADRTPDIEFLDKVHDYFDVPIDYLLGYSDNMVYKNINLGLITGLSDEALKIIDWQSNSYLLSLILENKHFKKMLDLIEFYIDLEKSKLPPHYESYLSNTDHESYGNYVEFCLAQIFIVFVRMLKSQRKYNQKTQEEIQEGIEEILAKFDKDKKEFEEFENELRRKSEEEHANYLIQEAENIAVRQKIKEAGASEMNKKMEADTNAT